jgi:hypothetical protein
MTTTTRNEQTSISRVQRDTLAGLVQDAAQHKPWTTPLLQKAVDLAERESRRWFGRISALAVHGIGAEVVTRPRGWLGEGTLGRIHAPDGVLTMEIDDQLPGADAEWVLAHECAHWLLWTPTEQEGVELACDLFAVAFFEAHRGVMRSLPIRPEA